MAQSKKTTWNGTCTIHRCALFFDGTLNNRTNIEQR